MNRAAIATAACLGALSAASCHAGPPRVEVVPTDAGHELLVAGEPYFIKGVGGSSRLDDLAAAGANSFRTWDAEGIRPQLDAAHERGLMVTVGIWLEHERHGIDYDDPKTRDDQLARVRGFVEDLKDHPAVLLWGLGNEVNLGATDIDKALRSIEEAAALTKSLDPDHPTMTVIPEIGEDMAARIAAECPSIDILGVNSYAGLASLPQRLTGQGYTGPYIVCEFGPPGHWEVGKTEWGEPFEPTSAQKAETYERNYRGGVLAEHPGRCLGSYAFLWGHKQETTGTWFGMFLPSGEALPTVDVMTKLWSGEWPDNRAPSVRKLELLPEGLRIEAGAPFRAFVDADDPEGDDLDIAWEIRYESTQRAMGGDHEDRPDAIENTVRRTAGKSAFVRAPKTPGKYRIYVVVRDGNGHAGTANLPFLVEPATKKGG
ncbi:MAG: hypothetical protein DHS20C14_04770 [Phycisphaeraceae bacterium]|nr:MAG: hypothetical protein DHS20C14_04770 [Phycisphaeraceae bacterium]